MPTLLVIAGGDIGARLIAEPGDLLGRSSDCHLRLRDDRMSRKHARFLVTDSSVYIEDLGSRNGTFVNDSRVDPKILLHPGDSIRVGGSVLLFEPNLEDLPARYTGGVAVLAELGVHAGTPVEPPGEAPRALPLGLGIDSAQLAFRLSDVTQGRQDVGGVLAAGLAEIASSFEAERGAILMALGRGGLSSAAIVGGEEIIIDRGLVLRVMETGEPSLMISEERHERGAADSASTMAVPIRQESRAAGLIVLERRSSDDQFTHWSSGDLASLQTGAVLLSIELARVLAQRVGKTERLTYSRAGCLGLDSLGWPGISSKRRNEQALLIAKTDRPVLLHGEPGTGRSLVARFIHDHSLRRSRPFLLLSCRDVRDASWTPSQLGVGESPIAVLEQAIELTEGGSICLSSLDCLPREAFEWLENVSRRAVFTPAGREGAVATDVRFMALASTARGRSLSRSLLGKGAGSVELPPLRAEGDAVVELFGCLSSFWAGVLERDPPVFLGAKGKEWVRAYGWPGNLREMSALIERLTLTLPAGTSVGPRELAPSSNSPGDGLIEGTLAEMVSFVEEAAIRRALELEGRKGRAAKRLGISRPTLDRKISIYGIPTQGRRT